MIVGKQTAFNTIDQIFERGGGGLNTLIDPFALKENESPKCNDILFNEDRSNSKRFGHEELKGFTFAVGSGLNDFELGPEILYTNATTNGTYQIIIDGTGTPDTFKWSDDGGSTQEATTVAITGALQTLNNGVQIKFRATTGHTLNDRWDFNFILTNNKCNGLFDFGVNPGDRKLVGAFGTTIQKQDDLDGLWDSLDTARQDNTHYFERSGTTLIICDDARNTVRTWDGSAATLSDLNADAPKCKIPRVFQGFLLLMNEKDNPRRIYFEDESTITTGDWADFFTLPAPDDDEAFMGIEYNGRFYVTLRTAWYRVSFVGGSAVFSFKKVSSVVGGVPRTIKVVSLPDIGEVIMYLGWNRRIYVFDGTSSTPISFNYENDNGQTDIFLKNINQGGLINSHAVVDEDKNIYRVYVPIGGEGQSSHSLNINLRTLSMSPFKNQRFTASVIAEDSLKRRWHICGGYDYSTDGGSTFTRYGGKAFRIDRTNKDVSTAIDDEYISPKFFRSHVGDLKKEAHLMMYFEPKASYKLDFYDRKDFELDWKNRTDIPMYNQGDDFLAGNFILNDNNLGSQRDGVTWPIDIPIVHNSYQYRLKSASATNKPWVLYRTEATGKTMGIGSSKNRIRGG